MRCSLDWVDFSKDFYQLTTLPLSECRAVGHPPVALSVRQPPAGRGHTNTQTHKHAEREHGARACAGHRCGGRG